MIELCDLSFTYTTESNKIKPAVKHMDFCFEEGKFYAVIGPNGSGKSTLSKLLNGLYKPTSGTVTVDNSDTSDTQNDKKIKRLVGLVFQNPDNQLVATVVEEDVAFGPENLGIEPGEIRIRVDEALKAVNMYEYKDKAPHKLSGGQKQRVAIAGVLAMRPKYIVLDEPTAMLDPKGRKEVIDTVLSLKKEYGITVILITHFMEEAYLADCVLIMKNAELFAYGEPHKIFEDYDLLQSAGLSMPVPAQLIKALKDNGIDNLENCFTLEECVNTILNAAKKES